MEKEKIYDLEERSFQFAQKVRSFIKTIKKSVSNCEDAKQLARSSGSVGANYIEANGSLGKKDFIMRIRICRKEAKESRFWLRLVDVNNDQLIEGQRQELLNESKELISIFSTILRKTA